MAIITIKDNYHDIIFIFVHFQCLSMHTCTHTHTHTGAVQQEMFDHTHVCIYVHTSTHTRYQGTADSAVHKSTGTVSAFLGHRQCSVPKGTHTCTHTYGHTFTHRRTHTHTHTKEQYNKRCLTTHMYVYMYVQAHTPDTRELPTVLFTKARALFRPFWAIVSAVYPKEHHTRTHTHVHTRARTHTKQVHPLTS